MHTYFRTSIAEVRAKNGQAADAGNDRCRAYHFGTGAAILHRVRPAGVGSTKPALLFAEPRTGGGTSGNAATIGGTGINVESADEVYSPSERQRGVKKSVITPCARVMRPGMGAGAVPRGVCEDPGPVDHANPRPSSDEGAAARTEG